MPYLIVKHPTWSLALVAEEEMGRVILKTFPTCTLALDPVTYRDEDAREGQRQLSGGVDIAEKHVCETSANFVPAVECLEER